MSGNDKKAYETLRNRFPEGAKAVDWRKATGLPESTFFRVVGNLTPDYVRKDKETNHYQAFPEDSHESNESAQDTLTYSHTLEGGSM